MNAPAPLPEKVRKLMDQALQMMLPVALKAAGPTMVTFGRGDDTPSDKPAIFSQHFTSELETLFRQLQEKPAPATQESRKARRSQSAQDDLEERISKYSLMDTDLLEAQLAAERLSTSLEKEFQFPVDCLGMRLEKLLANTFERAKNPFQAKHLTLLFRQSCDKLLPSKNASDLAMKNWGEALKGTYGSWLDTLNQTLVQQHVLPQLDKEDVENRYRKKDQEKSREMRSQLISDITGKPKEAVGEINDEDVMRSLYAMLTQAMARQPDIGKHVIQGNAHGAKATREDVLQTLQQVTVESLVNADTGYRELPTEERTLAEQIVETTDLAQRALDNETQNAISLLSMMFDRLQQEDQIADPIKPLLTELQLPVLQLALKDHHFFADPDNPAQELVNEIAKAGTHWSPKENVSKDPFYRKLAAIVGEISQSDGQDELLFDHKLQELKDFLEKEERRAALLEERIIKAELAKARTEAAQAQAHATAEDRITRHRAPELAANFLRQYWVPVLFFYFNRDEDGTSAEQDDAIGIMDDLLRACSGDETTNLDNLLQEITSHCHTVGCEIHDQEQVYAALRTTAQKASAQREADRLAAEQAATAALPVPDDDFALPDIDTESLLPPLAAEPKPDLQNSPAPVPELPADSNAIVFEGFSSPTSPAAKVREEKPVVAPAPALSVAPTTPQDQFDQQAAALRTNTWLRLESSEGSKIKVKLAAIIKHNGNYIFVNREGIKVITTDKAGVAQRLRSGELCVVDDAVFFDRALESVIQTLRQ